jgi:hypothetical protein
MYQNKWAFLNKKDPNKIFRCKKDTIIYSPVSARKEKSVRAWGPEKRGEKAIVEKGITRVGLDFNLSREHKSQD